MDGSELKCCSAGVFDAGVLRRRGDANPDSFSFEKFLEKTSEWGHPYPRPKTEYAVSPNITSNEIAEELADFSINKVLADGKKRNLQNVIYDYVLTLDGVKHMFCIHSKARPHFYYSGTMLRLATSLPRRARKLFPVVLIVTNSNLMADAAYGNLRENQRKHGYLKNCRIINLTENLPQGPRLIENNRRPHIDIAVGSAFHVINYIKKVHSELESEMLKQSVKHVVLIGVEALPVDKKFHEACKQIGKEFRFSPTKFIFMYNFIRSPSAPLQAQKACANLVKGAMYIEVERQGSEEIFDRIELRSIVPTEELVDGLVAMRISKGWGVHDNMFNATRITMTPQAQKLIQCEKLIMKLRVERQKSNQERRRSRKERILIVTKNSATAILVCMYLHMRREEGDLQPFEINRLLVDDSYEDVEIRNFDFRWGDLDVLVIDWPSIQAVNRGTVDAVIVYDAPEKKYFQTWMETEIQCLISRNCVRIKLYILFDKEADILLLVKYAKLLEKYNKKAPQWFVALYTKYLHKWNDTYDADRTIQPSQDEDETLK